MLGKMDLEDEEGKLTSVFCAVAQNGFEKLIPVVSFH